ncbi:hypothetical protein ZWY2020_040681 [Hordeum vulgare]|nr:hypothetical protein ZWY2020_040681 [Hordeum vulgare]
MARLGLLRFLPSQPMLLLVLFVAADAAGKGDGGLRFRREDGTFKVLQVADMHYADGLSTPCRTCSPRSAQLLRPQHHRLPLPRHPRREPRPRRLHR